MEKLPKYATITIDSSTFGRIIYKQLKDVIKKHGVSKTTVDIVTNLAIQYGNLNKQDPAGSPSKLLTLADTQRIEGVLSKADKASNAKLFVEDKFSKNNISEASYAHQAIKSGSDCLTDLESQLESNYVPAIASSLELYRSYLRLSIAILTKKYSEAKVIANEVIANEPELSKAIPTEVITFIDEQLGASSPAE